MSGHQLCLILAVVIGAAEGIWHRNLTAAAVGFIALAQLV